MGKISLTFFFSAILAFGVTKNRPAYVGLSLDKSNPTNPGPCTKSFHGQIKLVKDRLGKDRIIMCTKESNGLAWKSIDGSSTVGEYYDPAIDCSDVVDRVPDAIDGFYWVKPLTTMRKAVKVWCDVTSDDGGFTLVAKKDNAVTWTVPSTNETVSPKGKPHWSSIFGGLSMLDIRIRFSTTNDFKDTKADWSFRLSKKRPLGQLLVRDEGGCSKNNPGIGHIAYVKDLQTGKIVNTNFRCSLFSGHLSSLVGWGMMNKCLQNSCSPGFAFLPGYTKIRLDDHGSFSYSAYNNAKSSGILHRSTAYIGCAHKKCCACYGPKGGTNNYCLSNCTAINGGKVINNVHTWIWIRSSLPKRVWKKCMEYTAKNQNGKEEKYRINYETGVPEKGACANPGQLKQSSAVLVATGKNAIKKVPPVPGLLLYRPNNQELFVQGKGKWNMVAMEKKVKSEQQQIKTKQLQMKRQQQKLKSLLQQTESKQKKIKIEQQQMKGQQQQMKGQQQQIKGQQQQILSQQQLVKNKQLTIEKEIQALNSTLHRIAVNFPIRSCKELKNIISYSSNGYYRIGFVRAYCDMSNGGWTLVARFSNRDSKYWIRNSYFWYDKSTKFGNPTNPSENNDMISEAFWKVKGKEMKITRSDDSSHTALLQTTSNCLQGNTFRSKITSYGNYRNSAVWASNQCRGNCRVRYGGRYTSTVGFGQYSCSSSIQSRYYIGFWCDWSSGDGAVMMIGGGGSSCNRADHGIGITEEDAAKFGSSSGYDFGDNTNAPSTYALNLWVR